MITLTSGLTLTTQGGWLNYYWLFYHPPNSGDFTGPCQANTNSALWWTNVIWKHLKGIVKLNWNKLCGSVALRGLDVPLRVSASPLVSLLENCTGSQWIRSARSQEGSASCAWPSSCPPAGSPCTLRSMCCISDKRVWIWKASRDTRSRKSGSSLTFSSSEFCPSKWRSLLHFWRLQQCDC